MVPGVAAPAPGQVDFDVSVSPDGGWLYVSVGQFGSGSGPSRAGLALYHRRGRRFVADPRSAALLAAVNRAGPLVYAASVSADDRELFFTVADPTGRAVQIDRAERSSTTRPFGHVQRVAAISGFAEAPSLSGDGTTLYYHAGRDAVRHPAGHPPRTGRDGGAGLSLTLPQGDPTMLPVGPRPGAGGGLEVRSGSRLFIGRRRVGNATVAPTPPPEGSATPAVAPTLPADGRARVAPWPPPARRGHVRDRTPGVTGPGPTTLPGWFR